jgi:4-hydroxy-tetrahydrodipicolinate reductase
MQSKSLHITLLGYGRMGHEIEKIMMARGHKLHLVIDSRNDWMSQKDKLTQTDIAIDFSIPEAALENIFNCLDAGIPVVSGTTGWHNRLDEVKQHCVATDGALFYAPNFSLGMNMVFHLNKSMASMIKNTAYEAYLRETHHKYKKDAPSGTAIKLANDIISLSNKYKAWTNDTSEPKKLYIESVRVNEVPGTHEIVYQSPEDEIIISHMAKGREGFAMGAVVAAEFLYGRKGIYNMDDLIENLLPL